MTIKTTAALIAIIGATVAMSGTANAAPRVTFDFGNVSLGYSDGYYDNDHHWHRWAHRHDAEQYRSMHAENYHEWRHNDRRHHDDH